MRDRLVLLIVGLCVASPAVAAPRLGQFTSKHYNVNTDVERDLAKRIASHMDLVYGEYANRMEDFRGASDRMNLFLFRTQQGYIEFLRGHGMNAQNTAGLFFVRPELSGLATFIEGQSRAQMYSVLQHEGFHQFAFFRISPHLPIWANEGIAEYFAEAVMVGGALRTGRASAPRIRRVVHAIDDDRVLPFDELLSMSNEQWSRRVVGGQNTVGLMYDQAWSMVHFLVHKNDDLRKAFMTYLRQIHRGASPDDAFHEAFGADASPRSFERHWQEYMLELEPDPITTATMQAEFLAHGVKMLHEQGTRVRAIGTLKEELRKVRFRLVRSHQGQVTEISAADDENFKPPPSGRSARPASIKIVPVRDRSIPAEVIINGLEYRIRAQWVRDKQGKLAMEIVYE